MLIADDAEMPNIEHKMCARHIYRNSRKLHPNKPQLKKLFWSVVESHNEADYKSSLKVLEEYDKEVYADLMARRPETCSIASFLTALCCEDALNNNPEPYNRTLEKARAMPLVEMLETMRRLAMKRIDLRKKIVTDYKGKFSLKDTKMIASKTKYRKYCKSLPGPTGEFEVSEDGMRYAVDMRANTCSCRRWWYLSGIPCRHALRFVLDQKKTYKTDNLVSDWYLTSKWQHQLILRLDQTSKRDHV